jgi:hypothetical protein
MCGAWGKGLKRTLENSEATGFKAVRRFSGIGLFSVLTWRHTIRYEEQPNNSNRFPVAG